MKTRFIALCLSALAVGCSSKTTRTEVADSTPTTPEANVVAQEQKASYVTEITFPRGSSGLTEAAKVKLDDTLNKARRNGTIKDIKVIAWADKEYPAEEKKELSKADRDLADHRASAIDHYVKDQTSATVDTYNMAKRPSSLSRLFATSDADVKKSLEDAGISNTERNYKENASKAMMMVILK